MATQAQVIWYDDMTGDEFAEGEGDTVKFSIDGKDYEIDLSLDSQSEMFSALAVWIDAARKVRKTQVHHPRTAADRHSSTAIRAWAIAEGLLAEHQLNGRMPGWIKERYEAAH